VSCSFGRSSFGAVAPRRAVSRAGARPAIRPEGGRRLRRVEPAGRTATPAVRKGFGPMGRPRPRGGLRLAPAVKARSRAGNILGVDVGHPFGRLVRMRSTRQAAGGGNSTRPVLGSVESLLMVGFHPLALRSPAPGHGAIAAAAALLADAAGSSPAGMSGDLGAPRTCPVGVSVDLGWRTGELARIR